LPAQPTEHAPAAGVNGAISMDGVVLREPGRPVSVEPLLLDPPGPDEVLVRVAAAGVCHSDVHLADGLLGEGRWPMVLGHEGAGVVEAVGAGVTGLEAGDHVVFSIVPSCGNCRQCRSGRPNLCEPAARHITAGTLMDGTSRLRAADGSPLQHGFMVACFASYAVVPAAGAVRIPAVIPFWQAALLGCGVITGIGAVKHVGVGIGDSVCVIGCGGVGLHVIAGARLAGAATIIAIDRDEEKLDLACGRGATHTVDARQVNPVERVQALADGGVDYAFEVVGNPSTIRQAWDMLSAGGTAVVVGVAPRGVDVSLPAIELLGERTLTGSYYGSSDVAAAIAGITRLVIDGRLGLDDVITHVIELDDVEAALERLRRGEGTRSMIVVDEQLAGRNA
jgi:S-(hydroxymethyl)glutathione dehydrogenase/alcohol dehydrogenase